MNFKELFSKPKPNCKEDEFRRNCTARLSKSVILDQEKYLSEHPEIGVILKLFTSKMAMGNQQKDKFKQVIMQFLKPVDQIEKDVAQFLNVAHSRGQSFTKKDTPTFCCEDTDFKEELQKLLDHYYPEEEMMVPSVDVSLITQSSSFISIITSDATLPTPEPVKVPEPTMEDILYGQISNLVDKAVYGQVGDAELKYDTAYVAIINAVEEAMEIPVIEIRKDIANLYDNIFGAFERNILEKERIAAEIAWEKRMRKKLKRLLRRQNNFKGYEPAPSSTDSVPSSHPSYLIPPLQPCECSPQFKYNRYAKDKYGIYKPRAEHFNAKNTTVTPVISAVDLTENMETQVIKEDNTNSK